MALGLVAYAVLTHWLMSTHPSGGWTQLIVLGPLALAGGVLVWQRRLGRIVLVALAAVALWAWQSGAWRSGVRLWQPEWLYLAQHAGIQAVLALSFAATLRPGREPMITLMARRVHGQVDATLARYTRRVTQAWVALFALVGAGSVLLYAWAPLAWWSAWANLITPVLMVALFLGEYGLRYRLHPEFERVGPLAGMQAWRTRP